MAKVYVVSHHWGCNYCNADAYEEASENIEGVFRLESDANKYIKQQKRIYHEENCAEDLCLCDRESNHAEWIVQKIPMHEKESKK